MASENGGVIQAGSNSTALGLAFFLIVFLIFIGLLAAGLYIKTGGV